MGQPFGDGDTVFVVHGSGFVPLTQVTVELIGHGFASFRPVADRMGTFNYAIDQGHAFFAGPIPPGTYHVLVTGARGRHARASFAVSDQPPPPAGGPSPTSLSHPSPPGGSQPPPSAGASLAGRGTSVHGA